MTTFRSWAMLLWILGVAIGFPRCGNADDAAADDPSSSDCRLIVNWDEINMWLYQVRWAQAESEQTLTPEQVKTLVEEIVNEHAKARVDRLAICVCSFPWGTSTAGFKSINRAVDRGWFTSSADIASAMTGFDDKYDMNQVILQRSHHNGMEFIAGFRMNDRHVASSKQPYCRDNPAWRMRELSAGMDYKFEGIRAVMLAIIEETLERHDVDGVELDWMRHCHMFNPSEAEANAPLLTDFVVNTRRLLDEAARRRGRDRLVLGVRVPQTIAECKSLGFDIGAWAQEASVDYVCPADFMQFDANIQVDDFVNLIEGTNCKVYPTVSAGLSHADSRRGLKPECLRAAAHNYYTFGASGLSTYNFYNQYRIVPGNEWREAPPSLMLVEWPRALQSLLAVRDPQAVARGDRHYLFPPLWRTREYPTGATKYDLIELHRDGTSPADTIRLRMADDLSSPDLTASLEFKVTGLTEEDVLEVVLNGMTVPTETIRREFDSDGQAKKEGRELPAFYRYHIDLTSDLAKFGDNLLSVRLTNSAGTDTVEVQEFEILVREH